MPSGRGDQPGAARKGAADTAASRRILDALFSTITNANFDDEALKIAHRRSAGNEKPPDRNGPINAASCCPTCRSEIPPAPSEYEAEAAKWVC